MSYSGNAKQKETATISDASSGGDKLTFTPAVPVEIIEFGIIVTTALVKASGTASLALDTRPTAGSDTGRVDDAATATFTNAQANKAAGKVLRCRPNTPVAVAPGQQAILELDGTWDSGAGTAYIVFREAYLGDGTNETVVAA